MGIHTLYSSTSTSQLFTACTPPHTCSFVFSRCAHLIILSCTHRRLICASSNHTFTYSPFSLSWSSRRASSRVCDLSAQCVVQARCLVAVGHRLAPVSKARTNFEKGETLVNCSMMVTFAARREFTGETQCACCACETSTSNRKFGSPRGVPLATRCITVQVLASCNAKFVALDAVQGLMSVFVTARSGPAVHCRFQGAFAFRWKRAKG